MIDLMPLPQTDRPYSVHERSGGDPKVAGGLITWHMGHVRDADRLRDILLAAHDAEIAELQDALQAAKERRAEVQRENEKAKLWDAFCVMDWETREEALASRKTKSVKLPFGYVLGSRTMKAKIEILDPAPLMTALPECTKLVLNEGEAKKRLVPVNGKVAFADTGEFLPEGCARVAYEEYEKHYMRGPDGVEMVIPQIWQPEGDDEESEDNDAAGDAPAAEDDAE